MIQNHFALNNSNEYKKHKFYSIWVELSIHFIHLVPFYTPLKYQKTSGFLMFSGGV